MNIFESSRRALGLALLAVALAPAVATAQDAKPLEWVVGYAAGGGSDTVARTIAEEMSKSLKRAIIVNNKPGAATNIAADYAAKSKDYGNIMLTADFATLAANPALFAKLPYNAEADFVPVGLLARFPLLLVVHPSNPAKNFKEFAAWVKSNPGGANYASSGPGSPQHLAAEMLKQRTGLPLQHVAYRGGAPAVIDLVGGQVPFALMDTATVQQYVTSGKLRAIGVASKERLKNFPDVPTLSEQGLTGFEASAWQGLVVPKGTSPDTVLALNKALQAALSSTAVKARLEVLSLEPLPGTPEQMASYVRSERDRWGTLIRKNQIRLD
ncbi:tripartite tricarboxylate transporter substrate binding protein [Ramlibacter ginsenosidimutans]|uniref:Tripartite tricarboxylate transporter substrate binding protein n=1 Tax=Ramlibacter ginsenosidimutans TaxID=502333 RepID=A0A934WKY0_9BURK|nr:tripartite tricarboxylate transporter substrate binding protein [Ramlibacter ginsenosidimutans]MBK6004833.1 tripartite tricarboxylate transporter substrate binding protein [Ramlibacter ginsenosidimutans]